MSYKRVIATPEELPDADLTKAMASIGMNFAIEASKNANIENTLFLASIEGLEKDDIRTLSLLVTWLSMHSPWVNVDRLFRLLSTSELLRAKAFWSAMGIWLNRDSRFSRFNKLYSGSRIDLLRIGTEFQVRRFGEDSRFNEGPLRVPANLLRNRMSDILSPQELARQHCCYHYRLIIGPTYRADMWAALENNPSLTVSELARITYGSFATAWRVKRDWNLVNGESGLTSTKMAYEKMG